MKIALIGTRGVPVKYGGMEKAAEEIGKRLVGKGHTVWVYCRAGHYPEKNKTFAGMRLVFLPEFRHKNLETISHSFLSLLHVLFKRPDIILLFNVANSPLLVFPQLFRIKTALLVDGLEWKRDKWSFAGKRYYQLAEWLATKFSRHLVADSREIKKYYLRRYEKTLHYISYGAPLQKSQNSSLLEQFGLEPQSYFLQITRFEPENNPDLSIQAFQSLETEKKLVLVGGATYASKYAQEIHALKNARIKILGFIYDRAILRELLCNCYAYIHGNEVGGTNPALIEAMGSGCFVISRDVTFNREVLQDAGIYFQRSKGDLSKKLEWTLKNPDEFSTRQAKARKIIQNHYQWDAVASDYETLFQRILRKQ